MNVYELIWLHGKKEFVIGNDISDAINNAGIGRGALQALDYWKEVSELPDHLKKFEIVSDNGTTDEIFNPSFINKLNETSFEVGSITEIKLSTLIFKYQFIGKSKTGYQYKQIAS
ncbi:hypothetical protein [Paenibacillus sp. NAIST15-1]|uniref:hypothetical protein n=1 Tax=Paenibacillus sp. NAIST15-1 TaxID=1605994 RepID=UPI00086D0F1E|nr:hypothetical protein [Paenibacillus sp. NAIST15-1]GAV11331.1 hypothetical protein PBN151_1258 [Paenibacillus sp. NAIST15-1]